MHAAGASRWFLTYSSIPRSRSARVLPDVLGVLESNGYGVLQLPPPGEHRLLLAVIADQLEEYAHHGYAVVAIGLREEPGGGPALAPARPAATTPGSRRCLPATSCGWMATRQRKQQRLAAKLASYDLPESEQRRWRV